MPHMSDINTWTIQISAVEQTICDWITAHGGPTGLTFENIFELIQYWNTGQQVPEYNFTPDFTIVFGTIQYWNNNIEGGNGTLGCGF